MSLQYNELGLEQLCKCPCMLNLYNAFEKFILSSKNGDIYRKILDNTKISKTEYDCLLNFIIDELPIVNNNGNISLKENYKNKLGENTGSVKSIYSDCKYRFSIMHYQKYDEYGPIDEGEKDIYDCNSGYSISLPSSYSIMIIVFFLNIITQDSCISYYNSTMTSCIKNIYDFCKHYSINYGINTSHIYKKSITFPLFKGFDYYGQILENAKKIDGTDV